MELLPPELLPAVPHIVFGVFDLAIPNLLAWATMVIVFGVAIWARLPKVFEPSA